MPRRLRNHTEVANLLAISEADVVKRVAVMSNLHAPSTLPPRCAVRPPLLHLQAVLREPPRTDHAAATMISRRSGASAQLSARRPALVRRGGLWPAAGARWQACT